MRFALTLLVLLAALNSCLPSDTDDAPVSTLAADSLYNSLLEFQLRLEQPFFDPYYAGISFDGKQPTSSNLVVFLLDASKRDTVRAVLGEVLGTDVAAAVKIRIWEQEQTAASEEWKLEVLNPNIVGATIIDYNELVDRLFIGVENLEVVGEYERHLQRRGLPREAFMIMPEPYIIPVR